MLRYLRENTGNWIIKIFLGIIVVVFIFLGVGSFNSNSNLSIATINDEPVSVKEYQQAYRALVDQYRARFGNNVTDDLLKALNAKQQALDSLIDQKIMLYEADKLDIQVSEQELQDALLSIKAFQQNGVFNLEHYKQVLRQNAMTPEIFEQNQFDALKQQKLMNMVLSTINISDLEAKAWYVFQNSKVAVDYLVFDPAQYTDIQTDDAQVLSYYEEHKEEYKTAPMRKAAYIRFSPADHTDRVTIDQNQVQAYYEQNPEKYHVPEKVEARHILIKVAPDASEDDVTAAFNRAQEIHEMALSGQDFEALARQYSEGPSKDSGGYLGTFEKDQMVQPFAQAAFSVKPGEISQPVRTDFGWHIIQVMNRFDARTQSFDQVADQIRTELEEQTLQNIAYEKAGEAFDAVIDGDDFEQVALIADKTIQMTPLFDRSGNGLALSDKAGFARAAFELNVEVISDVLQLGEDYYLIKVLETAPPVVQAFDAVKDQVKEDFLAMLRNEAAKKDAAQAAELAYKNQSIAKAGNVHQMDPLTTPLFSRNAAIEKIGSAPEFAQAGFALSADNQIYPEVVAHDGRFYVIGFNRQEIPDENEIEQGLEAVKNEISMQKKSQALQAWMAEIKTQYDIQYDARMLN